MGYKIRLGFLYIRYIIEDGIEIIFFKYIKYFKF